MAAPCETSFIASVLKDIHQIGHLHLNMEVWRDIELHALFRIVHASPIRFKKQCRNCLLDPAINSKGTPSIPHAQACLETEAGVVCDHCENKFASVQKLSSHLWRAHRIRPDFRRRIDVTHCPACMKEFWTRPRILHHFYRAPLCRQHIFDHFPVLAADCVSELDDAASTLSRKLVIEGLPRFAGLPAVRLSGPKPFVDALRENS